MRNCSDFQEVISLYIDDCLDADEKDALLKHIENCPECREELQSLQEIVGMFNSLSEEELIPPGSFRRELRKKLEKEQKAAKVSYLNKFTKFVNKSSLKTWMPLAAAAVLLFVIVPVLTNGFGLMGAKGKMDMAAPESPQEYDNFAVENNSLKMEMKMDEDSRAPQVRIGGSPEIELRDDAGPDRFMTALEEEQGKVPVASTVERKIIKTGHLNLKVDSYKATTSQIKDMAREMQGYIVSENTHVYNQEHKLLAGSLALRIPQERFDEALDRVEQMGSTDNRSVDSQDVTEEYVDVESRLKAMRLKEERLLSILNKTGTLGDVLAVEKELASTRADLEALEGRLKYLSNRTDLSTININVRETLTPVKKIKTTGLQGVFARTQEAFVKSINYIIIGFGNLVVYFGSYLPFIILSLVLLVILWVLFKKLKKRYIHK